MANIMLDVSKHSSSKKIMFLTCFLFVCNTVVLGMLNAREDMDKVFRFGGIVFFVLTVVLLPSPSRYERASPVCVYTGFR